MMNPRKQLRKTQQLAKRDTDMSGEGSYLFQNNTKGDYQLPRPTKANVRNIPHNGQFVGDSYYMSFVRSGELRLVKELMNEDGTAIVEQLFVFKNRTRDDLHLPAPSKGGQTVISVGGDFIGDSQFFPMLKTGQLTLVSEVRAMDDKLITEQPPLVTNEGQMEFVVHKDNITEQETKDKKKKKLNENPLEGVRLLLD